MLASIFGKNRDLIRNVDGIYYIKPVREEMENFKDRDTILLEQAEKNMG